MNKTVLFQLLISTVLGGAVGFYLSSSINALAVSEEIVNMDKIRNDMHAHVDECSQDYQDGLMIAGMIQDPYLKNRFLKTAGYLTYLDFKLTKEVWVENCSYNKEIYNTVGLGL